VASEKRWKEQTTAEYRNLPYAPPDYPGAPFRARLPIAPFDGAEGWKCSVYYYWWEYLRRHEGYRVTCERVGKGPSCAELYKSFGNVHDGDFHQWWWSHLHLFTFVSDAQRFGESSKFYKEYEGVFLHVGYSRSKTEMIANARTELMKLPQRLLNEELKKSIRFTPAARPVLKSLHQHLLAWDARLQNPELGDAELCDFAGLDVKLPYDLEAISQIKEEGSGWKYMEKANRRAKTLTVQRHLRIARQYIDNVALGKFPLRSCR
jgi:hypothetical protein